MQLVHTFPIRNPTSRRNREKYVSTAKAHCCVDHNMFETEKGGNTNIPLHPLKTNIATTCSKQEIPAPHPADRKAKEKRQEEQKEKLRIEEREEKLRIEQLGLDEQKRKDEFELEKLRIQTQSKLGADTSKESDIKFLVKAVSKFIHRFDLKEDISLYLKLFERQAQRLNINQENWVSHLLGSS
ncbi:hypothetical protein TNCV_820721 [Trichonephila clavipes]|nr:hypothetical protein TNCV_820721 [Trichonephila clavipes]